MQADLYSIIAALYRKFSEITKDNEILSVLNDIELIDSLISNDLDNRFKCVSKIYHSYYSVINFDNGIINASRYADDSGYQNMNTMKQHQVCLKVTGNVRKIC